MVDAIYRWLMDRDFALEDPEVVLLLTALINILGHDNRGDGPTEVLKMAAYGERGVLDRPNMRVMRWRNGALSGSDLANEPGLGSSRTYQSGEMPIPSKTRPGLRRMHEETNSEAASSSSQLRVAVPPKKTRIEEEVQANEMMQDLQELSETKIELDQVTKALLSVEEDKDMWKRLFEDCNKERSERLALTTAVERTILARDFPHGQSPMELLTTRELSQTIEVPTEAGRVTLPYPSDTLGDPVVQQTMQKLIEMAGRPVASRGAPGSGVTAPYGTIDDTGRVEFSQETMRERKLTPQRTHKDDFECSGQEDKKNANEKNVPSVRRTEKQPGEEIWSSGHGHASMFQSIDLESSSKHTATAARDITFNTGRQFGESSTELEDLVDHQSDGLWRRHDSAAVSNGGTDEPRI